MADLTALQCAVDTAQAEYDRIIKLRHDLSDVLDAAEQTFLVHNLTTEEIDKIDYNGTSLSDHIDALLERLIDDAECALSDAKIELEEAEQAEEDELWLRS